MFASTFPFLNSLILIAATTSLVSFNFAERLIGNVRRWCHAFKRLSLCFEANQNQLRRATEHVNLSFSFFDIPRLCFYFTQENLNSMTQIYLFFRQIACRIFLEWMSDYFGIDYIAVFVLGIEKWRRREQTKALKHEEKANAFDLWYTSGMKSFMSRPTRH